MTGAIRNNGVRHTGWVAALLFSTACVKADPIPVSVVEPGPSPFVITAVVLAILLEAVCISLILRRWRRPRLFILWLMGMHLLTYPIFLGWLWLTYGMQPTVMAVAGEGLIVLLEGSLIYLICRFISSRKSPLAAPSLSRSLLASLLGNICSAAVFPLLVMLFRMVAGTGQLSVVQ
ncbi:MAG TPA: hypothetical protein VMF08_22060 [Candidatus Sulfotelmatobacter sp.]|nr:hypothetical protein [Candidatus Sulfotelmatobacter sp.]